MWCGVVVTCFVSTISTLDSREIWESLSSDRTAEDMGMDSVVYHKVTYQAFFWVLIDLIMELLGLIIKPFDNQTKIWA